MRAFWHRPLRHGARATAWVAGGALIALAVAVALAQLLLPLAARHPQWVAAQLSGHLQRPVSIRALEGHWRASGPWFVLHDVNIAPPAGHDGAPLRLPRSELRLDFGAWLLPSRHLFNLHVRGLQLDLSRERDGRWRVNGVGMAGEENRQPLTLGRLSAELWLQDLRVHLSDVRSAREYALTASQLRVSRSSNGRVRLGGTLRRDGVGAALRTAGDFRDDGSSGRLWLGIDEVALQPLLAGVEAWGYHVQGGHGQVQAWLDWKAGKLSRALARINVDAVGLDDGKASAAQLGAIHGLLDLQPLADGYRLRWADDDGGAMVLSAHQLHTAQARVGLAARHWQLAPWLPLLALRPGTPAALGQWLGQGHARALVSGAALRWSQGTGLQALRLDFTDAAIEPAGKFPGITALRGSMRGDAQALVLSLPEQVSTLRLPSTFRQPLALTRLGGTLALWQQGDARTLGIDALDVAGADYAAQVRGELTFPSGGGTLADLYVAVPHAMVTAAKAFWPLGSMSPATIAWLDRALLAGRIDNAQVVLQGNLADWPFAQHDGRFEARVPIHGLTLDYGDGWPHAEGVDVVAQFINNGLHAQASGHSLGVRAEQAVADIADFGGAPLMLSVRGSGSGADVMRFVRQSPIGSGQAETLGKLTLGGSATFDFTLQLPLHDDGEPQLAGTAQLRAADLRAAEWKLDLRKLDGPLRFDAHGVQADALRTDFRGQPASLALALGTVAGHEDTTVWAQLRGTWPLSELVRDYPTLAWIGQAATGTSDFSIGYSLAPGEGGAAPTQRLQIASSLRGTALDLPAPLRKTTSTALPLQVSVGLPIDASDVQISVSDVARVHLRLADANRPLAGVLAFGTQMPQELPPQGLRIRGHAAVLDVTGWIQRTAGGGDGDGPLLQDIHVSADQAQWFGKSLGAMRIDAATRADVFNATIDGAAIAGNVAVPTKALDRQGITGRLKRLYWPKDAPRPVQAAADKPAPPEPDDNPAQTGINPAALPPLHLWVGDLRLGEARLGEARLETWPTAEGMHIEQLRALSRDVQVTASGNWVGNAQDSHTRMRVNFAAEDLGAMLGAFGFEGLVHGGRTHDQLDARWPGSPTALSLATMDGTLSVKVEDGRIPSASSPGVGRLLGLVSLAELPRRMSLDFGDVFGKGLAFDTISGDFHLANGNATTSNLTIAGSAAHITISGRTGLRARDYDQQVLVVPRVGNSLPLVGAVVGGPVGAAAGFAVQGLLGKGLNKVASARYRITGPWSKPVMTLIEKHGVELPPKDVAVPAPSMSITAPAVPASVQP
ncbi:MAG: YhdP family protein [Rhodanobacter sp.]